MAGNEIILYGTVGASFWDEEFFTARQVREQLAAMSGDIVVRINSGGGVASEGQAIFTMLKDYPGRVTVVVDAVAASAASLIAMAGDDIVFRLGAWMLIHDPATPWTAGRGTEDDHRKEADLLRVISGAYAEVYAARAGISREEARAIMRDESVLDGSMALQMGFATALDTIEAEPVAAFDYRIYAHAPQAVREASQRLGAAPERVAVMAMIAGTPRQQQEIAMSANPETAAEDTPAEIEAAAVEVPAEVTEPEADKSVTASATKTERARVRRIIEASAVAGLPGDFANNLIESGASVETALDQITAAWKGKGDVDTPMTGRTTATITRDERDTRRDAMASALYAQIARKAPEHAAARPFMGLSIAEMAAAACDYRGPVRTPQDRTRALEMASHSVSDFPAIFENVLNKRLMDNYAKAEPSYREVALRMDFADYRPHPINRLGDFPMLQEVGENGEIKSGTFSEKKETVTAKAYAIQLPISRQMLINDDLGAIDRLIATQALSAVATEDALFWGVFLSGANADGPTLTETTRQVFNTTDVTKASANAAITVASVGIARAALRKKKSLDGQDLAWLLNSFVLLVGPDKETEADQLMTAIQSDSVANVNPFSGRLRKVVTAKITGNSWYLLAEPSVLPNFMYGFLQGQEGPRVRMDEPFGSQGMKFSIEIDFGCGAIDFRGGFKNVGA
jgi:ATP-dependent protease ClpP protease subunit